MCQGARKVVEVASGPRFEVAQAVARALPGCEVLVTDVDPRVREAPPPLRGEVDDLLHPQRALYEGAALLYAVRLPEDLHVPAFDVAQKVGALLALQLLGDEGPAVGRPGKSLGQGWTLWEAEAHP